MRQQPLTQLIHRIDPISIYTEYLIRQALTRNAREIGLKPQDIILSKMMPVTPSMGLENTIILEHRQSLKFEQLLAYLDKAPSVDEGFFKTVQAASSNLTIKRINGDPSNSAGWHYGRPRMFTIVTLVASNEPLEDVVAQGLPVPMEYVMSNVLLDYPEKNEGPDTSADLLAAIEEHRAMLEQAIQQRAPQHAKIA